MTRAARGRRASILVLLAAGCGPADRGEMPRQAAVQPSARGAPASILGEAATPPIQAARTYRVLHDDESDLTYVADFETGQISRLEIGGGPALIETVRFGRMTSAAVRGGHFVALTDQGRSMCWANTAGTGAQCASLPTTYSSIAVLDQKRVAMLPAQDTLALLDLFDAAGTFQGSIGDASSLRLAMPKPCVSGNCPRNGLAGSRLVAAGRHWALIHAADCWILTGDADTGAQHLFLYADRDTIIRRWRAADEPVRQRMQAAAAPSATVSKAYFVNAAALDEHHLLLSVIPSTEEQQGRGYEAWTLDLRDGTYHRYGYPDATAGYSSVMSSSGDVVALDTRRQELRFFVVGATRTSK